MASGIVYRDLLLHKRHGLPFWTPEPDANLPDVYKIQGISIGDLGLLTDDGGFDYLFNIHATADDPINNLGTPTDFNPLQEPDCGIRRIESFHSEGSCITRNVAIAIGAGPAAGVGLEVEFTIKEERAAMLVLPHGADRHEAKTYQIYEAYAMHHGEAWYRFVNQTQRRGARNGSLYLVTGCDKGRSWGLAAGSQLQEHTVGFKFSGGSLLQGNVGFHASWRSADGLESRKYPLSITDTAERVNQCVFARGLVIGINKNILKKAFSGTVRWTQIGCSRPNFPPAVGNSVPFGCPPGRSESTASAPQLSPPRDSVNDSSSGDLLDQKQDVTNVDDPDNAPTSAIVQVHPQYPKQVLSPGSYICDYLLSSRPDINVIVVHDNVWIGMPSTASENIFNSNGTDYELLTARVLEKCQLRVAQGTAVLIPSYLSESPGTHPYHDLIGHEKWEDVVEETKNMGADSEVGTSQEKLPATNTIWKHPTCIGSIHMVVNGGDVVLKVTEDSHDPARAGMADHEIYFSHLVTKGRGCPLWLPGPGRNLPIEYRRQGISIGDVGVITSRGGFDFFFNIFLPADHPINRGGVPCGFLPLDLQEIVGDIEITTTYGPETYLASPSVRKLGTRWHSETSTIQMFESTGKETAILVLPDGATSQDLQNTWQLRSVISNNAAEWYTYARDTRGRDISNGDIRVVIGVDKVSSWGIATSTCNTQEATYEFTIERDPTHRCIDGSGRVGPRNIDICDLMQGDTVPQNQCVFVRTLNFTLAGQIWDDLPRSTGSRVGGRSDQ